MQVTALGLGQLPARALSPSLPPPLPRGEGRGEGAFVEHCAAEGTLTRPAAGLSQRERRGRARCCWPPRRCSAHPRTVIAIAVPLLLTLSANLAVAGCRDPLPTVPCVDLGRFAGCWHEVARLPNIFQRNCVGATARYTPLTDGGIRVENSCRTCRGRCRSVVGRADPVPCSGNARLRVRFSGLAGLMPVSREGNYWIIALDDDYQWAMVGTPDRRFLWILARSPSLSREIECMLISRARCLGFAVDRLVR